MKSRIIFVALMAAGLMGCDVAPNIKLYNGFSRPLVLDVQIGRQEPKPVELRPGAGRRLWNINGPVFRLKVDDCWREYALPEMEWNHPWPKRDKDGVEVESGYLYPLNVLLGPDFDLYLMPSKPGEIAPSAALKGDDAHGYPLHPVSTTCESSAASAVR